MITEQAGHAGNLERIGLNPRVFAGLDFDSVSALARDLYTEQQRQYIPQSEKTQRAGQLNDSYHDFKDDPVAARQWPFIHSLDSKLAEAWRLVQRASVLDKEGRLRMAQFLGDLVTREPASVFSGQPFRLRLFDLQAAGNEELGGLSKLVTAESSRLDILENAADSNPETRERIKYARYTVGRSYDRFAKEITVDGAGSVLVKGEPGGQLVGLVLIPDLEKLLHESGLSFERFSPNGLRFDSFRLHRITPEEFAFFTPYLCARLPALEVPEAPLIVSFKPGKEISQGYFCIEGQVVYRRGKHVHSQ